VYRDFKDVDEFRSALEHLLGAKDEKGRPIKAKSGK
jgi:transcriptional regulator NrdR family protein